MEQTNLNPIQEEVLPNEKKTDKKHNKNKKPPTKMQKMIKQIVENTILFILIMLFIVGFSALFGSSATLMGVCVAVGILIFLKTELGIKNTQAPFVIWGLYVFIGLATFVEVINPWLGIAVNLVAVFIVMVLSGQRVEYRTFLPFILCYVFAQSSPAQGIDFGMRMASLAAGGALVGLIYFVTHLKKPSPTVGTLTAFKKTFHSLSSIETRFYFRMAIGMAIALFIGDITGSMRTLWLGATILSLTQPLSADTAQRTVSRLFATLIGGLIYITIFDYIIPPAYFSLGIMATGYLMTYAKQYQIQQILIVISALGSAHLMGMGTLVSWEMRLGFVAISAVIVIALNIIDKLELFKQLEQLLFKNRSKNTHINPK